jgi:putative nucleotidyltransferase with HDIG domain
MTVRINNNLDGLKNWFACYVKTFTYGDQNLRRNTDLKEKHTMEVCKLVLKIGEDLGLGRDELCLSEIVALFHDVGRFEQYARYRTFADGKSEDHARLGVEILKRYGVLSRFDEPVKSLVYRSIRYHNRASLPENETEQCLLFTKLLRDADKLDIWRVVTEYYHRKDGSQNGAIELDLPDTPGISEPVYQDLADRRIVDFSHVRNLNDFKLLQVSWVFDINFEMTRQLIRSGRYFELIREVLPESSEIQQIFNLIRNHLDRQL